MKLIKPLDIVLIAVVALFCCLSLVFRSGDAAELTAIVYIDGEEYATIDLTDKSTRNELVLPCSPPAVLIVENGTVRFKDAECRDKLCIKSGVLDSDGDTAVCLPARCVVRVDGNGKVPEGIDVLVF